MNKLLTTITLLCFSVAANAEVYFCESTHATLLGGNEDGPFSIGTETDDYRIIVDTTRGFRVRLNLPESPNDSEYRGSRIAEANDGIQRGGEFINCKEGHDFPLPFKNFSIRKSEVMIFPSLAFWYLDITVVNIVAAQGFCEKA